MHAKEVGGFRKIVGALCVAGLLAVGLFWWYQRNAFSLAPRAQTPAAEKAAPARAPLFEPISLKGKITTVTENWGDVPKGLHHSDKVPFVCEGAIRLAGRQSEREGKRYAAAVFGVPVQQRGKQIHVLQGPEYGYAAPDGIPYGKMVLHYAGGQKLVFYFIIGTHGLDWYVRTNERPRLIADPNTKVGWLFERPDGTARRLFHTIIANPHPDEIITHADFISTVEDPNLFLFGLTLGNEAVTLPPPPPPPLFLQSRQIVTVHLVDGTGQPLTNAVLAWQVESRSYHMTFPPFQPDALGRVFLDLPRRNLMKLNFSATGPGDLGAVAQLNSDPTGTFPPETRLVLQPGAGGPLPANPSR